MYAVDPDLTGPAEGNVIRGNRVERTLLDGFLVDETATGSLLKRNRAIGAGDDGFDVESPDTTLTRNTANRNRDLGIEAVPGVTNGGDYKARDNADPLQCIDMFWRRGLACVLRMSQENVENSEDVWDLFVGGDRDGVLAFPHPQAEIRDPPDARVYFTSKDIALEAVGAPS